MKYILALTAILFSLILHLGLLSKNITLGKNVWHLSEKIDPSYYNNKLPKCEICQKKLFDIKIAYYSFVFHTKFNTIKLFDRMESCILSYTETTTTMKRDIPTDFVYIQPSLDHFTIQRIIRTKRREADETYHDFINTCLDNGSQLVAISKKHNEQWDTLVQKWIERYRTHYLDSGKDLNEHDMILRELHIRCDWLSHSYQLGKLLKKQLKEIRSLSLLKFMRKDYPAEFSALYEYYENIHDTLIDNTLYLMKDNLEQVTLEFMSALNESSLLAIGNNRSVSFIHDKSSHNDRAHKSNIVMVTASKRFKKLKNNLKELWYNVPKSSLKLYFTEPTAWGKFFEYLTELYAWIKDSIQEERRNYPPS